MIRLSIRPVLTVLLALAALLLPPAPARGAEFTPNHLFVSSALGRVFEFAPSGELVRTIQVAPYGNELRGLVFGPTGRLFVADQDGHAVYRVHADETVELMWDASDGLVDPIGLSFGSRGELLVVSRGTGELLSFTPTHPHSPSLASTPIPSNASDAVFDPMGELVVTRNLPAGVFRLHRTGSVIDSFGSATLGTVGGLGAWRGFLVTTDYAAGSIHLMTAEGITSDPITHPQIVGPWGVTSSPRRNLVVACFDADRVVELAPDGTAVQLYEHPDLHEPTHVAYAPFLLQVKVKRNGFVSGHEVSKDKDKDAILSYAPGSGTMTLVSTALPFGLTSTSSIVTHLVLRGSALSTGHAKKRVFTGAAFRSDDFVASRITAAIDVLGKLDDDETFRPKKVKGTIELAGTFGRFELKVKGK